MDVLLREFLRDGHNIEEKFGNLSYPIDPDRDGKECPLSKTFVTQHSRQRCTMLNNFKVMGAFSEVFDTVESEQEQIRQKHFKERCWRENELEASAE